MMTIISLSITDKSVHSLHIKNIKIVVIVNIFQPTYIESYKR